MTTRSRSTRYKSIPIPIPMLLDSTYRIAEGESSMEETLPHSARTRAHSSARPHHTRSTAGTREHAAHTTTDATSPLRSRAARAPARSAAALSVGWDEGEQVARGEGNLTDEIVGAGALSQEMEVDDNMLEFVR